MRCKILHESKERMRVHLYRSHMTPFEADRLEYYLDSFDYVKKVSVNERTSNAIIFFDQNRRDEVLSSLSAFDIINTKVAVPEHTGRELRIEYEDEMFFHIARKVLNQLFLPASICLSSTEPQRPSEQSSSTSPLCRENSKYPF